MALYHQNAPAVRIWQDSDFSAVYCGAELVWQASDMGSDWFWTSDETQVTLLSYRGNDRFVTIPSYINGMPVKILAATACDHAGIRTITFPETITELQ